MKKFFTNFRDLAVAGLFFLLPAYVLFIIFSKAWISLSSIGGSIARMFGVKSILGVGGSTILSGFLMIAILIACGLLTRFSFAIALNRAVEKMLSKYIPGYDTYKALAEEKLHNKAKMLPYTSALMKQQEYWRPVLIVEQDSDGNCVVFLPDTPESDRGSVLLAKHNQLRILSSVTANQFATALKKMGKGLLSEHGIHTRSSLNSDENLDPWADPKKVTSA